MDEFQWDSPEHVGVARLDEQHRELHRLVTDLIRGLESHPGGPEDEAQFIKVFEVSVEHFKTEEDYLQGQEYPDLIPHRLEHELLLDWFLDQMVQRDVPKARPLILLAKEAGEIIQRHHETVDRAYAAWLKDR